MGRVGRLRWSMLEPFGAELHVDTLPSTLTGEEQSALKQLFFDHQVLLVRNQRPSRETHKTFCGHIDRVLPDEDVTAMLLDVNPEIGGFGSYKLAWHRDLTYAEHPFSVTSLCALDVRDGETSTFIASSVRAYERLPTHLKEKIVTLCAVTVMGPSTTRRPREEECRAPNWPRIVKPLVEPHPVTGKPVLTVCYSSTLYVEGMDRAESEDLILELIEREVVADNVFEQVWHNGDLILWDNFGCLHARKSLAGVTRRTLQRVLCGKQSQRSAFPDFDVKSAMKSSVNAEYFGPYKNYEIGRSAP